MTNRKLFFTAWLLAMTATGWAQGPNDSGTYYQAADGKKGAELKTALCGVVYNREEGGDLNTAYKALWTHFRTTDAKPNGKVWDMYSNKVEFEFGTNQDTGSGNQEGQYYNREHSMPNSWFGGKVMPMYTDLHHMYPTDKIVNNKRSNFPFGETNGESYKSANDFNHEHSHYMDIIVPMQLEAWVRCLLLFARGTVLHPKFQRHNHQD